MAALANDRNTLRKYQERYVADDAQVAANTTCFNGAMVASNAAGALLPAADVVGHTVLGIAPLRLVNTTGVAATVVPKARLGAGVYKLDTTGVNAITAADLGKNCFVLDDHTVVRAAGTVNSIIAGIVEAMDPDGSVWVKINC